MTDSKIWQEHAKREMLKPNPFSRFYEEVPNPDRRWWQIWKPRTIIRQKLNSYVVASQPKKPKHVYTIPKGSYEIAWSINGEPTQNRAATTEEAAYFDTHTFTVPVDGIYSIDSKEGIHLKAGHQIKFNTGVSQI